MKNKSKMPGPAVMRYLSYGIQLMASVGLGLWAGYWLDRKLQVAIPLLVWICPVIVLVFMLIKLVRGFSKKSRKEDE